MAVCAVLLVSVLRAYTLSEPPRMTARVDYGLGVVFIERWQGDLFLGVERVVSIDEYLAYRLRESIVVEWQGKVQRDRERSQLSAEPAGLIPDIELPKLPLLGEGSKIDISGRDRITLGGSQTFVSGVTRTYGGQRLFPELTMKQELAVSVNGTVGDRTKVTIDHDSERQEGQNKVKLTYTGTEDEVVRSVELGDTRLTIPGTGYTGDLPSHQGLFGVSAKGKLAGVDVYAVASREESQSQSQSFTGRRRVSTDTIYARDYVPRRYYQVPADGQIRGLRVYVDDRNPGNNQAAFKAVATVFPDYPDSIPDDSTFWTYDRAPGDFDLKSYGSDYVLHEGNVLEFVATLGSNDVVGLVVMTDTDTLGGRSWRDSLVLQLLKPERTDSLSRVWDLELRNFYALRQGDVKLDTVRLFRDDPHGQDFDYEADTLSPFFGQKFTRILGLDPNDDGRVEYPEFETKTGVLRFPMAKPFASTNLRVRDSIIYRLDPDDLTENAGRSYYLVASYYTVTETYFLGQTDITSESEKVLVNGRVWQRGTDYNIDYKTGIVTFLTPLPPDADVQVTFEYRPWFSSAQKSLAGTRAEWAFAQNGKVGSSVFYRSEGIAGEKPELGAEPFRRMIAEADASWSGSSDAVSAFLDRLPLIRAQSATSLQTAAEMAMSLPDPNTRGVAYLDDFETTTITRSFSNSAILWSPASVPVGRDTATFALTPLRWTTPLQKVRKDSVFGPNTGDEGSETQDILRLVFTPNPVEPEASWAGIMNSPPEAQLGMNFKDIENLQLILRSGRRRGNVNVTIGMAIDEDAPRRTRDGRIAGFNGRLDTEDRNGNGVLDEGTEDTGLDTIYGADSLWAPGSGDDGNDDYDYAANQQGTEGNNRLDSEDIDRGGFSRYNHYHECTIPLAGDMHRTPLFNGWQRYRLTLRDSSIFRKVGNPKWEDIRVVRVWLDGFDEHDTLDVYSLEFTGSKWRDPRTYDLETRFPPSADSSDSSRPSPGPAPADTGERVWVAQISRTTDTNYVPPFDLKRDVLGRTETEASLLFGYSDLGSMRQARVAKALATPEDYRDYRGLRIYVHDDGNGLDFLLRLGTDSLNYYQFRAPVSSGTLVPGRDGKWYEFSLDLDSFPVLKARRDSASGGQPTAFSVVGTPSLADVRHTALGIVNRNPHRVTGAVWFDDIRLVGPRREPGYGVNLRAGLTLSDLGSVAVSYSYSDPNFRRFSEGRGVKTGGYANNLSASARMNLDRLLPGSWGMSIPLVYSWSQQTVLPKFSTLHPDLRLQAAPGDSEVGVGRSQDLALEGVRKQRSGSRLLNYTLEALDFSWRRRAGASRGLLVRDSSFAENFQWGYSVSPEVKVQLGPDRDLYLFPNSVRAGLSTSRRASFRSSRGTPRDSLRRDSLRTHDLNAELSLDYSPLDDLTFEYGIESERDLAAPSVPLFPSIPSLNVGSEAGRSENFSAAYDIEIADILTPSVEFDGEFNLDRNKLDSTYSSYANVANSSDLSFGAGLDLPEFLDKLAPSGPKARAPVPGDSSRQSPAASWQSGISNLRSSLTRVLEPVDLSYTIGRGSDYYGLEQATPWHYRLGITDSFFLDTTLPPPSSRQRQRQHSLRAASGARLGELSARFSYDHSTGLEFARLGASYDRSTTWPSLDLSLGKVHRLFSKLATDSRLAANYQQRTTLAGELLPGDSARETLAMFGRTLSSVQDLNPLLSWTTTWKQRITTTLSVRSSRTTGTTWLSSTGRNRSVDDARTQGGSASVSYTFTAPQGLVLPFLRRVRFSSDLSLKCDLSYTYTTRDRLLWPETGLPTTTPVQRDRATSTSLSASYRFSRSVEAGLSSAYSYNKGLSGTTTQRTSLDIWALFRF